MANPTANIRVINPIANIQKRKTRNSNNGRSIQHVRKAIDRHWELMPKQARTFLLESSPNSPIDLHRLAKFWSSPAVVQYTRGDITAGVCGASWCLALSYLKLGKVEEARALTLNGSFLRQCAEMPIETIVQLCREKNTDTPIEDFDLPLFSLGHHSVETRKRMELYLQQRLPSEYQHMMESLVKTQSGQVMKFVDQIGDDWSDYTTRGQQKHPSKTSTETLIRLILTDDDKENEQHNFSIGSSATLKTLFNDYADKRGVSLRSLRFSYSGRTLFLSTAGNKTPDELSMRDGDVINVHGGANGAFEEKSGGSSSKESTRQTPKKNKLFKNSTKKTKGRGKKRRQSNKKEDPLAKPLEEYKAQHSSMLSKLHAELYLRLKKIRTRLNALELERQPPKQKKRNRMRKKSKGLEDDGSVSLPNPGVGGKAGRPYFLVQVGEVQNLYKTTKRTPSQRNSSRGAPATLDLHGCSRDEAIARLDSSLPAWVDAAMRGSYPFVMPVEIVCGCGNQVLSEMVEKWIRERAQVANARKNSVS